MINAVVDGHFGEIEGADTFQASNIHAVLVLVRTALVVRIDAAFGAKVVLRCAGVELIRTRVRTH